MSEAILTQNTPDTNFPVPFVKKKPAVYCVDEDTPVIGRHIFRKYEIITDPVTVKGIRSKGKMLIPITSAGEIVKVPLKRYLDELINYEESVQKNTKYSYRYLHSLETVLDRSCTDEQAKGLAIAIADTYGLEEGTYFARLYEHSGCRYICVYMSDRVYYKDPIEFTTYYPTDWCVDAKTRKRVKDGTPGSIVLHKKGDVRSVDHRHFSNKTGQFKMGPGELRAMSYKVMNTIKTYYDDHKIGEESYLLPRLDYTNFRGNNRNHIKNIDTMYQIMEDVLNSATKNLEAQYLDGFKESFRQIVYTLRDNVDQDSCVIRKNVRIGHNRTFKVSLNYSNKFSSLVYNMEVYVDNFMSRVKDVVDKVYEEYGIIAFDSWEETFNALGLPDYRREFSYRTYVWDEDRIPEDRQLTNEQWYLLWVKNGRKGKFRPRKLLS